MTYKSQNLTAFAGQISKAGESLARATGEQNVGTTPVAAGRFVALAAGGIKELAAVTDVVAGVVVRSPVQSEYQPDEYLSVGRVGHGDGIWVVLEGSAERGDKVFIRAVAEDSKPAGSVLAAEVSEKTVPSDFHILNVTAGLAEIGRL
ncbi:structural cement protein Gp24 [Laribacter hongkongensis]|uniref:structural cement protein Gp24 n=1 Tax=Laribacter hongkongensis TaxID=168471 RepID=UPI000422DFDC|nr:hypothetical protein [Laribacter hongkongensis]